MRMIFSLFGLAFVVIALCMGYLVWSGVSLRSAPIIRASPMGEGAKNLAYGVALRLSSELKDSHYVLWGLLSDSEEHEQIRLEIERQYEELSQGRKVQWLADGLEVSEEDLLKCEKPCWILLPQQQAHQLQGNEFIEKWASDLKSDYISLTLVPYSRDTTVKVECEEQQRLDFECLSQLSIQASKRHMKEKGTRYFFMRKYNLKDYFLFIEEK